MMENMEKKQIGVLISGRGSNLQALIDACKQPDYPATISIVISNRPKAPGLQRCAEHRIPTKVVDHKLYSSRESFEVDLSRELMDAGVDYVCNAGFMRLLTERFVETWYNRQLNIHPSLLPAYKGLHTHERVIADGVRITGCTVHFVRTEMDSGPIVAQAAVPVMAGDTADQLAARVLKAEHLLYPHALKLVASGIISVEKDVIACNPNQIDGGTENLGGEMLFAPALLAT